MSSTKCYDNFHIGCDGGAKILYKHDMGGVFSAEILPPVFFLHGKIAAKSGRASLATPRRILRELFPETAFL